MNIKHNKKEKFRNSFIDLEVRDYIDYDYKVGELYVMDITCLVYLYIVGFEHDNLKNTITSQSLLGNKPLMFLKCEENYRPDKLIANCYSIKYYFLYKDIVCYLLSSPNKNLNFYNTYKWSPEFANICNKLID